MSSSKISQQWLHPRQRELMAALPIVSGLFWLLAVRSAGWLFWGLVPGMIMLGVGVSLAFWPGDRRQTEFLAMGGIVGALFALPATWPGGWLAGALACALSLACYLVAGRLALSREPLAPGAPSPEKSVAMAAKAALDEALLGYFVSTATIPSGERAERMCEEALKLERTLENGGWLADPASFHREPMAPERVASSPARTYGFDYEKLSYRSGFVPHSELTGAQEWANHHANNECVSWLLRHKDGQRRPWLLCIHGYRMGHAWMDFGLFRPGWLHRKLGLNLLMPVLPLHGTRRIGLRSGDHYLDGDLLDLVHAQTQALWDLRRAVRWIRSQEPDARIGVLGFSLGGYNTALLATAEAELDFVVAGIPVADFASTLWRHLPPEHSDYFSAQGLSEERYRRILGVVSPLARPPLVGAERRYIFAGAGDRVVLPAQPLALASHWQVPVQWYQGGHLTFRGERSVRAHIEAAMQRAGWPVSAHLQSASDEPRPRYTS
jgi:hypothetical protein